MLLSECSPPDSYNSKASNIIQKSWVIPWANLCSVKVSKLLLNSLLPVAELNWGLLNSVLDALLRHWEHCSKRVDWWIKSDYCTWRIFITWTLGSLCHKPDGCAHCESLTMTNNCIWRVSRTRTLVRSLPQNLLFCLLREIVWNTSCTWRVARTRTLVSTVYGWNWIIGIFNI